MSSPLAELLERLEAVHRRAADIRYAADRGTRTRPSSRATTVQLAQLRALEHELEELLSLARAAKQAATPSRRRRRTAPARPARARRRA